MIQLTLVIEKCFIDNTLRYSDDYEEKIKSICNKSKLLSLNIMYSSSDVNIINLLLQIIEHTTSLIQLNIHFKVRHAVTFAKEIVNAIVSNKNITTVGLPRNSPLVELLSNYNTNNNNNTNHNDISIDINDNHNNGNKPH